MPGSLAFGAQLGSYRVESVIGSGSAGVVYRARHVRLGTVAALKVLAPEWSAEPVVRERFLHDVHVAAELDHRNVVPIHDAGEDDESLWVVTRYVAGGDLRAVLSRGGALGVDWAASVLGPVAKALDAAHARGLVHGDVKPTNVLVEWSVAGDVEHVYLTDFGMPWQARADNGATRAGAPRDRFDYASPEQLAARAVTPRADVYALGCLLYHAVTGHVPFPRDVLQSHLHANPQPPSTARPDLPPAVDAAILRAMAKDPSARFETCDALMRSFGTALRPEPAAAAPARAPSVAPAPRARSAPPAAVQPPRAAAPRRDGAEPAADAAGRRRRRLGAAVVAALAVVAAGGGYAASQLGGSGGGGGKGAASATAAGGIKALAAKDPLRAVIAKNLPDVQCSVTRAPAGGAVVENALCVPSNAGARSITRLNLTMFRDGAALNQVYESARALAKDKGVRVRSDCRPDRPWSGHGLWAGGRMFCETRNSRRRSNTARIVWTVGTSKVLGEATAASGANLGTWWLRWRDLRAVS
ncbi:MAG: serine/threonine protein kinase [Actinobacteria bacterium]|nr:MAG: serine/threonine protein kinase [Actinomycetota bacterium]